MSPATGFAGLRIAYALALIVAPGRMAARWLGAVAQAPGGAAAVRGLAARDLVLSVGVLASARTDARARPWLLACAVSDLADIAATLAADPSALPAHARLGTVTLAGASATAAAVLAVGAQ